MTHIQLQKSASGRSPSRSAAQPGRTQAPFQRAASTSRAEYCVPRAFSAERFSEMKCPCRSVRGNQITRPRSSGLSGSERSRPTQPLWRRRAGASYGASSAAHFFFFLLHTSPKSQKQNPNACGDHSKKRGRQLHHHVRNVRGKT